MKMLDCLKSKEDVIYKSLNCAERSRIGIGKQTSTWVEVQESKKLRTKRRKEKSIQDWIFWILCKLIS